MHRLLCMSAVVVAFLCSDLHAQYADVTATFVYKGPPPAIRQIAAIGGAQIVSENLRMNPINRGLRDVVAFPVAAHRLEPLDISKFDPTVGPNTPQPIIEHKGFQFVPHVLVMQAGQDLTLKNADPVDANLNFSFIENHAVNGILPPGGQRVLRNLKREPGATVVTSGAYNWMMGYLLILDHPYVGVSNADGKLEIKGLAPGKTQLKILHFAGKFAQLTIHGKSYPVKKNTIEIELSSGANDLGTIELTSSDLVP